MTRPLTCQSCRLAVVGFMMLTGGCRSTIRVPPSAEEGSPKALDAAMAQATALRKPLLVLVTESGGARANEAALSLMTSKDITRGADSLVTCVLDLAVSRNRAIAARFHPIQTPLLVCLSPDGVIISRDETPLDKGLVLRRIAESFRDGPELDAQLAALRRGVEANSDRCAALFELADFLLAHRNALEAIPDLAAVAHNETCADPQRVKAWVALARAHLWVGEPEKARVEAESLIASLGARLPEARAGGKLVLGIHDANLKRPALARREFKEAMILAPGTPYAKEAADMTEDLRKGWTVK